MADKSAIQWCDASWSTVTGCTRVSPGCMNCYSEALCATRLKHLPKYAGVALMTASGPRWNNEVRLHESELLIPLRWKRPRRIFVNSMSDTFHEKVPFDFLDKLFAVMALCPQHTFQVLTKRPERMAEYFACRDLRGISFSPEVSDALDRMWPEALETAYDGRTDSEKTYMLPGWWARLNQVKDFGIAAPPNVWLGTSVEDQPRAERIDWLRHVPAAVRFLSCEPLIGPLDSLNLDGIHWVIIGGESGPGARSMQMEWAESLVAQCRAAGVAPFVKQLGKSPTLGGKAYRVGDSHGSDMADWPEGLRVREFPSGVGA